MLRPLSLVLALAACDPAVEATSTAAPVVYGADDRVDWYAAGPALRTMRDATRGGVASVLNELARSSEVSVSVREADVTPPSSARSPRTRWR